MDSPTEEEVSTDFTSNNKMEVGFLMRFSERGLEYELENFHEVMGKVKEAAGKGKKAGGKGKGKEAGSGGDEAAPKGIGKSGKSANGLVQRFTAS